MILSISGKMGSGKDTVGKIIQYLTSNETNPFSNWLAAQGVCGNDLTTTWQIRKFAYKLKQCASIILGISIEDLEKEEVKNIVLGSEWMRYGYAKGFIKKHIGNGEMGEPVMDVKPCDKERYDIELKTNWQTAYKSELTVRLFLQLFGNEVGRQIHPDTWVNTLMSEYKSLGIISEEVYLFPENINQYENRFKYPNWIITDTRFPNEAKAVKDRDGILIRVNRFIQPQIAAFAAGILKTMNQTLSTKAEDNYNKVNHPSETALDDYPFDYVIDNNSTIEELIYKVKDILIKEKII